jgi:4-amino-4-deoxy-L-arabinose transferase-like glycosyltransferase
LVLGWAFLHAGVGILLHFTVFVVGDLDFETDFYGDLVVAARKLHAGHFAVANYPYKGPLYSFLLQPLFAVTGDWFRSAVVLNALCSAGFLVLCFVVLRRLFGGLAAALGTVFASVVVEYFLQSHRASTDILFMLLCTGSIACFCTAQRPWVRDGLSGVLAGLAFLTRYNGVYLPFAALVALAFIDPARRPRRARLRAAAVHVGAFLLVCGPWFVASWRETGQPIATKNLQNVVVAFYGSQRFQDDPVARTRSVRAMIAYDPVHFATQYVRNIGDHFRRDMHELVQFPASVLVLAGLLWLLLVRQTRAQRAFWLYGLVYSVFMGMVFYASRFFLPLVLQYAAAAFAPWFGGRGEGPTRLGGWLHAGLMRPLQGRGRWRTVAARAGLVAILAAAAGLFALHALRIVAVERVRAQARPLYLIEPAAVLAEHIRHSGRTRVMARKGHIALLADADYQPYPADPAGLEALLEYVWANRVDYVIYGHAEHVLLPRLQFMSVADTLPRLSEIYRSNSVRIFAVDPANREPLTATERHRLLMFGLRAARDPLGVMLACEALARFHTERGEHALAEQALLSAIRAADQAQGDARIAHIAMKLHHKLAVELQALGRPQEALELLQRNLDYFTRSGSRQDLAVTHGQMGVALAQLGRTDEAHREYATAHQLFLQTGDRRQAQRLQALLGQGQPQDAP